MTRLAIVGCGNHSEENHARPLAHYARENPTNIELVAACDLRRERAEHYCTAYGFARPYTDAETMLRSEGPDAVVCIMRQDKIAEMGVWLLHQAIPCVIEKPLGVTRSETEQLVQAALVTGTPHQVSVNRRYAPYLKEGREWAGQTGVLHYVRGMILRHRRSEPTFVWETGIHVTDTVRYLGGEVASSRVCPVAQTGMSASWCCVDLEFESGALGRVDILPTCGVEAEVYELFGENFHVRVAMPCGARGIGTALDCWSGGEHQVRMEPAEGIPNWVTNGAYNEVVEFVTCLVTGKESRSRIPDVARSMEIVWSAHDLLDGSTPLVV